MQPYSMRYIPKAGYTAIPSDSVGFKFIKEFGILKIDKGRSFGYNTEDNELGIMILSGRGVIEIDGDHYDVGKRKDVFSGLPQASYKRIHLLPTLYFAPTTNPM